MLWKAGDDMKILAAQHVKLGFIGLGNMGNRIAQRLLAHGYKLFVFDRNRTMAEALVPKRGCTRERYRRTCTQRRCDSFLCYQRIG